MTKPNAGRDQIRQAMKADLARPMVNERAVTHTVECPSCLGTGVVDPGEYEPAPCPECDGQCRVPRCPTCAKLLAVLKEIQGQAALHTSPFANHVWRTAEAARAKAEG